MIMHVLRYFLNDTGVLALTVSFEGHGKIFLVSTAKILIHSAKILETVLGCTTNLFAISSNNNPRRSLIRTASNSSPYVKLLFRPSVPLEV